MPARATAAVTGSSANSSSRNGARLLGRRQSPPAALGRAVAEPDHPFAAVAQMVGSLLDRLAGDGGELVSEDPASACQSGASKAEK